MKDYKGNVDEISADMQCLSESVCICVSQRRNGLILTC